MIISVVIGVDVNRKCWTVVSKNKNIYIKLYKFVRPRYNFWSGNEFVENHMNPFRREGLI